MLRKNKLEIKDTVYSNKITVKELYRRKEETRRSEEQHDLNISEEMMGNGM